ncbi:hypothetical protein ABH935_006426 [Catenulispora sp. GAS73]|uniref:hypothetical protein n=1 Tax=Catenulispora sp. GAS73 TaxID=3156269 RepID=UPI0035118279
MADRHAASAARQVDLAGTPGAVVDFFAALTPGEVLVVTRDGEPVATVTAPGGLRTKKVSGRETEPKSSTGRLDVRVVATAMKLSETTRTSLSAELGADYAVLDIHAAPQTADVLLVPPISACLLGKLRSMFPAAQVVVAEFDDPELGASCRGPVRRLLDSGADAYVASTTVATLARYLDQAVSRWEVAAAVPSGNGEIAGPGSGTFAS